VERLGDDIDRTLAASGDGTMLALTEITAVWADAVGEGVARQAWPLRVGRDGTLHVATSSATWAFELDRLAPEIGERLSALLGSSAPSALRFRAGPLPEPARAPDDAETVAAEPSAPTPEVSAAAQAAASAIEDPNLREIVEKAARASLERGRSGRGF
jgi:hypothetical protein